MGGIAVENEVFLARLPACFSYFGGTRFFPFLFILRSDVAGRPGRTRVLGIPGAGKVSPYSRGTFVVGGHTRAGRNKNKLISRRRRNRRVGGRGRLNRTINARGNVIGGGWVSPTRAVTENE